MNKTRITSLDTQREQYSGIFPSSLSISQRQINFINFQLYIQFDSALLVECYHHNSYES